MGEAGYRVNRVEDQGGERGAGNAEVEETGVGGDAGGPVDGPDPASERDGLDQFGRGGPEDLVQRAEGDAGDQAFVGLGDLAVLARHRFDGVARLDVAVGARRGHHAARRELEIHRGVPGLRMVGHLVLAGTAVR